MIEGLKIERLKAEDVPEIVAGHQNAGWSKTAPLLEGYLREQNAGDREVLVARLYNEFAGYTTIVWSPEYAPFREKDIPEINDFSVLPHLWRRGIGTALMDEAERIVATRSAYSGIGVGMGADYGKAQRMYVLRGYIPDGRGLMDHEQPVTYGKKITVSHDLAIYFTKKLR